jgi:hypothetical protein
MARRSPQTVGKRERELAKLVKRERKQQKKVAAAAARAGQQVAPATESESKESTVRGTE